MSYSVQLFHAHHIALPRWPVDTTSDSDMVCSRFLRHLEALGADYPARRILRSIQFVADLFGYSDAHVAKMLVDQGLRGPRHAFPESFLDFADQALPIPDWEVGGAGAPVQALAALWDALERQPLPSVRSHFSSFEEGRDYTA